MEQHKDRKNFNVNKQSKLRSAAEMRLAFSYASEIVPKNFPQMCHILLC